MAEKSRTYVRWSLLVLAAALVMAFFFGLLPAAPVAVATGSMEPSIRVGDAAVVYRTDPERLAAGDVVAYRLNGQTVIHRIIQVQPGADGPVFRTQGDHNNAPDPAPVEADQICGRVLFRIPWVGVPTLWLRQVLS